MIRTKAIESKLKHAHKIHSLLEEMFKLAVRDRDNIVKIELFNTVK